MHEVLLLLLGGTLKLHVIIVDVIVHDRLLQLFLLLQLSLLLVLLGDKPLLDLKIVGGHGGEELVVILFLFVFINHIALGEKKVFGIAQFVLDLSILLL